MRDTTPRRGVSWDQKANRVRLGKRLLASATVAATTVAMAPIAASAASGGGGPNQSVIIGAVDAPTLAADLALLPPGQDKRVFGSFPLATASLNQHWQSVLEAAGASVTPDASVLFTGLNSSTTPGSATCAGPTSPSTPSGNFPTDTGANQLVAAGDSGQGETVAVLDTGINASLPDFGNRVVGGVDLSGGNSPYTDQYGHGTFVAGLIAGNGASSGGQYVGEAPGANLVSVKVAGASGATTISSVLRGIDWVIGHRNRYGISVLNLSLGAIPTGPTAFEPLDQAAEWAWNSGIVVTVAAGNSGPFNGTILSPGDDPLVITSGAYADNNSTSPSNWAACPFSSVGPTLFDGWLKPDLVAPGRSVVSVMDPGSTVALANPQAQVGTGNFVGSGTSFSSAITAGAAALVLADNPGASPNEVKGRLLGDAMPGELGNPMVEGHGFLNAFTAAVGPPLVYNQSSAARAEWSLASLFGLVNLTNNWTVSSWNPNNWSGSSWNGSSWTGSSWTGSSWTGSSWTGSSWTNTVPWNGSSWTGSSWTNGPWNGSSWTGSSWNGSSWTGSSWTNVPWNGSSWTGSSWTGSSWTGSSWTGSSWTGSSWTGSSWTGMVWDGSSWTGSSWTGSSWTGSSWTGSSWTGSSWTGSSWTGSSWTGSSWTSDLWA